MRRNTPRIDGDHNELVIARHDVVLLCQAQGFTADALDAFELAGMLDFATTAQHIILFAEREIQMYHRATGALVASKLGAQLDPNGTAQVSSTCQDLVVWAGRPHQVIVLTGDASTAFSITVRPPPVDGQWILPISAKRWVAWSNGTLRLWRTIGDAWQMQVGDRELPMTTGQLLLNGQLLVLVQQSSTATSLFVVAIADGTLQTQLRFEGSQDVRIATQRGLALVRTGDDIQVVDLRLGRMLDDLYLPVHTDDFAIDNNAHHVALIKVGSDGLAVDLVQADSLTVQAREQGEYVVHTAHLSPSFLDADSDEQPAHQEFQTVVIPSDLPQLPLLRLDPIEPIMMATDQQCKAELDCVLDLAAKVIGHAIATAWDNGRIARPGLDTHCEELETLGIVDNRPGLAIDQQTAALDRMMHASAVRQAIKLELTCLDTPLQSLSRRFGLSAAAETLVEMLALLSLRPEYNRLLYILHEATRIDECVLQSLYPSAQAAAEIASELHANMPLRSYGIVHLGKGDRPFAPLRLDPMVVRYISGQRIDGERQPHLVIRASDRNLEELQIPHDILHRALTELSQASSVHVRIAVRGRPGCGGHSLLAALASRAGRDLGIINAAALTRGSMLIQQLRAALNSCQLRGAIPCIDGLPSMMSDQDPDTKLAITRALRQHLGPLAIRLPTDAPIPFEPGYLQYDIRSRTEMERGESWRASLARYAIELDDTSDLAARYRVGPAVIERVVKEVAHRDEVPATSAQWSTAFDQSVRQYLENKLGKSATRVTRLATWSDVVLPLDIIRSLTELTARVSHRKRVYETWGFDKSMTSSRGITALFAGTPGTGKTMVAGVIARELGLDLYRVDVSRITSKWIGETEKNLGSLFDAAEDGQVMLLFDEADSLFGKRTEAKTANDRYSNMETNYLLQRLDTFEGIAILTTNFGTAIDPAFKRRLTYRMTFPFPDEEMRTKLWAAMIPTGAPIRGQLDVKSLAQRFRLSGGYIRNAVLRAAFLAVEDGAISQEHLERAVRIEFRELGMLTDTGSIE